MIAAAALLLPRPATFAPSDHFCRETEQCAEYRNRHARRSTVHPGVERETGRSGATPVYRNEAVKDSVSPVSRHTSGSVTTYPGWAEDIQSLVAAGDMVVRSGMSNTRFRSMCSAIGMTWPATWSWA